MSAPIQQPSRFRLPPGAVTALALGIAVIGIVVSQAPDSTGAANANDPAYATAETMPLATRSLILDIANGPERAIAVGERGHVLVSESRREWRQVEGVPTRATLTAVTAIGAHAWAVGHDGIILHSGDGGLTWQRQRVAPFDEASDDPHNGAPLLDVLFLDEKHGLAIGAYSLVLRTDDGGATWNPLDISGGSGAAEAAAEAGTDDAVAEGEESWTFDDSQLALEEESDPHLNGITRTGDGSLFIVAERGSAFRSTDGGTTWQRLKLPYDGSMFGVIGYDGRHVLAFGLRGNVFESRDLGDNWTKIDTGVDVSIMGGVGMDGGGAALVGANGLVLTRSTGTTGLLKHTVMSQTNKDEVEAGIFSAAIALVPGGDLVAAGENGIGVYTPN
jgi:photosystem II stability/assembly factor-like uncharacterized protein